MYLKDLVDKKEAQISFHMPGHKENYKIFEKDILHYDLTEYDNFDNLANPESVIKKSLERISHIFESEESHILVNGSTGGILATLFYLNTLGGTILAYRYSHKSFFNAISITGQKVEYFSPIINQDGFFFKCNYEEIEKKLDNNKDIRALFITSPTYEGAFYDIKKISEITKSRNVILVVDEAHGAHFNLNKNLPTSSVHYADIVINSLHKTLPAPTQTALLHTKSEYREVIKYVNMVQTSSPSYIFMYAIDKLMNDILDKKLDFDEYIVKIKRLRNRIRKLKNIKIFDIENIDITRITIYSHKATGSEINEYLISNNIYCEMYINNYIILITSVCDTEQSYEYLISVLEKLDKLLDSTKNIVDNSYNIIYNSIEMSKMQYTYKDALSMEYETINITQCANRVSKEYIIPYPPGIPLVLPGEIITENIIKILEKLLDENIEILGVKDKRVNVIRGE